MEQLLNDIKRSGLQKGFIAGKVGVKPNHFSMMLNGKANMPEDVRNKVNTIVKQALQLA